MTQLAAELDARLKTLDPFEARYLESLLRDALLRSEQMAVVPAGADLPPGYFDRTAAAIVGEEFERPTQGELPTRDDW